MNQHPDIACIRVNPDEAWMMQVTRNLLDSTAGFLRSAKFLAHDRDPLFTKTWKLLLNSDGITSVAIPAQSPNCNPHAERFIRSVRNECLECLASLTYDILLSNTWPTTTPTRQTTTAPSEPSRRIPDWLASSISTNAQQPKTPR